MSRHTPTGKMAQLAFTTRQLTHAPVASRQAFERNLCAQSGGADCVCEMYDGHDEDEVRTYRNPHHCECGRGWR